MGTKMKLKNVKKAVKDTMDTFDYKWHYMENEPKNEIFSLLTEDGLVNCGIQRVTINPIWIDLFKADVKLPEDYFKDKLVCDAGCGYGRNAYAMSELGAKVVAFDYALSGCEQTYKNLRDRKNVHVTRADVNHPPFKDGDFDFVMSWGVLHHTPDTKHAFDTISRLVKQNGILWVHLYEKSNPPRAYLTEFVRFILQKLPVEKRYKLCRLLVLPKFVAKRKILTSMVQAAFPFAPTQAAAFDAFSPRYNHRTSSKELLRWFEDNGFEDIDFTNVQINKNRIIKKFFSGEYGGFLMCRGKKVSP